jgi:branched-chain amino acid transport system substrate-binding protein
MPGNPPQSSAYQALAQRYQERYGEPHTSYFTESYDAMQLAVRAVIASDGTKENIRNKLYEVSKNYQGVSGNLEFDQNGDVIKSILVKQIKNGKFAEYKQ